MRLALALVIAFAAAHGLTADGLHVSNPHTRVRPMQKHVESIVAAGMARSATFRTLVRRLEASDVIVYIETRRDLREGVGASMKYITSSASDRFVRIQLNASYNTNTLVALLGHELQHAVEVADNPDVQSPEDLRAFYRRHGVRTGPDAFDSTAARETGYLVRAEILRKPGDDLRMALRAPAGKDAKLLDGSSIVADETPAPGSH